MLSTLYRSMKDFDILLINHKGIKLNAHVKFIYPNHFVVDILHLMLTLKITRNAKGNLECEDVEELHSTLVHDICQQINRRLNIADE